VEKGERNTSNEIKEDEEDARVVRCDAAAVISGSQSRVTRHWLLTASDVRTYLPSQRGSAVL
jgi:hypothetical protein